MQIKSPNKEWVAQELDKLFHEWLEWKDEVGQIVDHPYDAHRESQVFADGRENMQKHRVLQAKTIEFLNQNIKRHGFIYRDGRGADRTDLRLNIRVQHRIDDLDEIKARLEYASVTDGFWREQGKKLIGKIVANPFKAVETAATALKNSRVL
ncbi:MAG: hypothetical protein ACPG1C_05120 [Alphaproteobacteria bacterium]